MNTEKIYPLEDNSRFHDIIDCLVGALEAKDYYTCGHSIRVGDMAYDLAEKIGIKGKELENIHIAGHLHDIGKIGVPEQVLNKKGALLPEEWSLIRRHPEIGCNILCKSHNLDEMSKVVLHHHERWDGKGYPAGLKGKSIPLQSRIIAVCDTIDAMTSERPYRKPFTYDEVRTEILLNRETQFDPDLVDTADQLLLSWKNKYQKD